MLNAWKEPARRAAQAQSNPANLRYRDGVDPGGNFMPLRVAAAIVTLLFCVASAAGADLRIALGADVTSIDPHYHNFTPNSNVAEHIFETLVTKDPRSRLKPAL